MASLGTLVCMKYILAIALTSQASRPEVGRTLENRNPELRARRVKALDWNLHQEAFTTRQNAGSRRLIACWMILLSSHEVST